MAIETISWLIFKKVWDKDIDLQSNTYLQQDMSPTVLRGPVHFKGDFTYMW